MNESLTLEFGCFAKQGLIELEGSTIHHYLI